jgi:hypothetical protein
MARRLALVVVPLVLAALLPAVAQAARPRAQVLVDTPPAGFRFGDKVLRSGAALRAHASDTAQFNAVPTKEGYSVAVAVSQRYTSPPPDIAQSYVDFLDSLPHGAELAQLKVYIAPPDEVSAVCGGPDGTLACYESGTHVMAVPGEQSTTPSGVTTSYVVTHEYGHHIADFRSNAPFSAFASGPKYWSSYEMVCDRASRGQLFPGDEADHYFENPGEGWAETYAHLKYPDVPWTFSTLMLPDAAAYAAAAQDVAAPWTNPVTSVFRGSFAKRGAKTRRFRFTLNLDGALSVRLQGPRRTNYDLSVASDGGGGGRTSAPGSRDSLSFNSACRTLPVEHITVAVRRISGSGPFTLRATYAG